MKVTANPILWQPSVENINKSHMMAFMKRIHERYPQASIWDKTASATDNYTRLYQWSITDIESFWREIWDYCEVKSTNIGTPTMMSSGKMLGTKWFPEARLNFAENLLHTPDQTEAVVFCNEGDSYLRLTRAEIVAQTAAMAAALRSFGVKEGDVVAAYIPNREETLIFMLAAASIGAVFAAVSSEFGIQGVITRFSQIKPKILLVTEAYNYEGNVINVFNKICHITQHLYEYHGLQQVIVAPYTPHTQIDLTGIDQAVQAVYWDTLQDTHRNAPMTFVQLPFNHPLYIVFSSGTTGPPKCIVHNAGGVLLQHLKEHQLHTDIHPGDRVFYYSTTSWMMWNWMITALASRATLLIYRGSPLYQKAHCLFDFLAKERCSHLGTSAKFITLLEKQEISPKQTYNLEALRVILSTGSPLNPEGFEYVYQHIKTDVCLSSISGGTDILSTFVLGNPLLPVRRGEIQCRGLGMAVEVFNTKGESVIDTPGELVCTKPFPSMPIGYLYDIDEKKYHDAYFAVYPNVWCHGDYCKLMPEGGFIIQGRSDTALNPNGIFIGTAEIYEQVEKLDEILESIVVGQMWKGEERMILFVHLREYEILDDILCEKIANTIRNSLTPRHVPSLILEIDDIPRTRNGKISELAVKNVLNHRPVRNIEELENPETLMYITKIPALAFKKALPKNNFWAQFY